MGKVCYSSGAISLLQSASEARLLKLLNLWFGIVALKRDAWVAGDDVRRRLSRDLRSNRMEVISLSNSEKKTKHRGCDSVSRPGSSEA